jgi:uncharacterized membrane protein YphA (DoxX/SURF4 family)
MALLALGLVAGTVTAHVEYVASEGDPVGPLDLWGAVASDPLGLTLIATTVVAAAAAGFAWRRWGERIPDVDVLREVLDGYEDLVPWMIRLSVGVPLVGAGFSGYLLTPALPVELRLLQVLVGFLLLLGLTTRGAALLGLVGWLSVFGVYGPTLFLAGEYTGAFIALILVGPGRPSLDHMLEQVAEDEGTWYHRVDPIHEAGERFRAFVAPARPWAPVAVRLTLGATLAYLGIWEKILDPGPAIALARDLGLPGSISAEAWVVGAGLVELGVGLLLVAGLFTRAASAAAFLVLTVTLFALPNDPVLAHVSLFGLASVVFTWGAGPLSLDRSPPTGDR